MLAVAAAAVAVCTQPLSGLSGDDRFLNKYAQLRWTLSISHYECGLLSDLFSSHFFFKYTRKKKAHANNDRGRDEKHMSRPWI